MNNEYQNKEMDAEKGKHSVISAIGAMAGVAFGVGVWACPKIATYIISIVLFAMLGVTLARIFTENMKRK